MVRTLEVTTAATETGLTTLAQLKSELGLDSTQDAFYQSIIDRASEEIGLYLNRGRDEEDAVTLGRETVTETFYDLTCSQPFIALSRRPIVNVVSVTEGTSTRTRLLTGADGAITATETTLTSAAGVAFTQAMVGKAMVVTGAGASGADLSTTVASVTSETEIELTDAADTTVSGATYTVVDPSFPYVVRKSTGMLHRKSGTMLSRFYQSPVAVSYEAGFLMPGETGRNLPTVLEEACILFCRHKIDRLESGEEFQGPISSASLDGLGSFSFADDSSRKSRSMPYEVRDILDRYADPVFA